MCKTGRHIARLGWTCCKTKIIKLVTECARAACRDLSISFSACTVLASKKSTTMPKRRKGGIGRRHKKGTGRSQLPAECLISTPNVKVPKDAPILDSLVQKAPAAPPDDNLAVSAGKNWCPPSSSPPNPLETANRVRQNLRFSKLGAAHLRAGLRKRLRDKHVRGMLFLTHVKV